MYNTVHVAATQEVYLVFFFFSPPRNGDSCEMKRMPSMPLWYLGTSISLGVGGAQIFLPCFCIAAIIGANSSFLISASWLLAVTLEGVCMALSSLDKVKMHYEKYSIVPEPKNLIFG